jgi:hypothetical protein
MVVPVSPLGSEEIRERLRLKIEEHHRGQLDAKMVGRVARAAGVAPTTLKLYFGFYPKKRRTDRLHDETLRKVLVAVDADPYEFVLGTGDLQLNLWPALVGGPGTPARSEGADHLRAFSDALRPLPLAVRLRAARAAINAGIGSIADVGGDVPEEAYDLLRRLDEMLSGARKLRLLA